MKYKIWNKLDTLYTPSGRAFTKDEIFEKYPLSKVPGIKFAIEDAPINMSVFMEFSAMVKRYKKDGAPITDGMTDAEILVAIDEWDERVVIEENPIPSVEERTASALEALVMLSIPDVV